MFAILAMLISCADQLNEVASYGDMYVYLLQRYMYTRDMYIYLLQLRPQAGSRKLARWLDLNIEHLILNIENIECCI